MGIFGALSTAVSGLRAQSFALENISGNIANSQTTGYKRTDTSFIDLIPDAPLRTQVPGAVLANSRSTNDQSGDISGAGTDTFMAINGGGFFVVDQQVGTSDGDPQFSGGSIYTRRGDFAQNKDGYLVNGAGYYLKGLPIDVATGNVSGSVPEVIKISNSFLPAQASTRVDYRLNLPLNPTGGLTDPALIQSGSPATINAEDSADFINDSVNGGAITLYSANGAPASLTMRWAKTADVAGSGADTWNLFYMTDSTATGTDPMWTQAGGDYTFNTDGSGTLDPAIESTDLTGLVINGTAVGDVKLAHGKNGVTEFANQNGTAAVSTLAQNGYGAGEFVSVEVNDKGRVVASYTNGEQVELAQVVLANFNAVNSLKKLDGGAFQATSESGEPIIDDSGSIVGGALEGSNTDISEEFTKLIVTQQAYSANTRIVSAANDMMQEALNMIR